MLYFSFFLSGLHLSAFFFFAAKTGKMSVTRVMSRGGVTRKRTKKLLSSQESHVIHYLHMSEQNTLRKFVEITKLHGRGSYHKRIIMILFAVFLGSWYSNEVFQDLTRLFNAKWHMK